MQSLLLIDDNTELLTGLESALKAIFRDGEVDIRTWVPQQNDPNPFQSFEQKLDNETIFVVTDYDLTPGTAGLFGSTIVDWCQARALPVGDFSRGNVGALPKEPNLFEVRVPNNAETAAPFIAAVFRGFNTIREELSARSEVLQEKRSSAALLSELLGMPELESQFALYGIRLSTTNAALFDHFKKIGPDRDDQPGDEKRKLLTYILGHLLLNAILRFPGPILSSRALTAYVGSDVAETPALCDLFVDAAYAGPFNQLGRFFWLTKVDAILETFFAALPEDYEAETPGQRHREAIERRLNRTLARHNCERCHGVNGGFLCPFTDRTVCQRGDCSVGANSWIPQGAKLCRIEREFYDEWAPILGV